MTGARLLYPDGRVQHAGLAIDKRLEHVLADGPRRVTTGRSWCGSRPGSGSAAR